MPRPQVLEISLHDPLAALADSELLSASQVHLRIALETLAFTLPSVDLVSVLGLEGLLVVALAWLVDFLAFDVEQLLLFFLLLRC